NQFGGDALAFRGGGQAGQLIARFLLVGPGEDGAQVRESKPFSAEGGVVRHGGDTAFPLELFRCWPIVGLTLRVRGPPHIVGLTPRVRGNLTRNVRPTMGLLTRSVRPTMGPGAAGEGRFRRRPGPRPGRAGPTPAGATSPRPRRPLRRCRYTASGAG